MDRDSIARRLDWPLLGAALALSLSGIAYAVAVRSDVDPFPVVYAVAVAIGVLGVLAARRTAVPAA